MTLSQLEIGTFRRNLEKDTQKKRFKESRETYKITCKIAWILEMPKRKKLILRQSCTEVQKRKKPLQRAGTVMVDLWLARRANPSQPHGGAPTTFGLE